MGMEVTLDPNYEDFSCQFIFGQAPLQQDADPAFSSPCFQQCPSRRRLRGGKCEGTKASPA
jgi:Beta-carotene isomerase D27-like, C-terminal